MQYRKILTLAVFSVALGVLLFSYSRPAPEQEHVQQYAEERPAPLETIEQAGVPDAVRSYTFVAAASGTVESLMKVKQTDGSLTYTSKEYPTLGSFLESIGDVKNQNGAYWILYINGVRASVGMSNASVVPGDTITWRYE